MEFKRSFLGQNKPLNTCIIQTDSVDAAVNLARNASYDGCDAFGYQLEILPLESRTENNLRLIFSQMGSRPIYVTNYRNKNNASFSDDELFETLFQLKEYGATLFDIMGDYFAPTPGEMTYDSAAVDKQKRLIDRVHESGGEVLMSSHIFKFKSAEEVLSIALEHQARGADISKIVTAGNSDEEEMANLETTMLLKKELSIPFLFLSNGTHYRKHRVLGPMFGCCMWLTVPEHHRCSAKRQPLCRAITEISRNYPW